MKMKRTSITIEGDLLKKAKAKSKAKGVSLSAIVRLLIRLWLDGKVLLEI